MERGTVSMRVAFVLRSAEVQPLFPDLCDVTVLCSSKHCSAGMGIVEFTPPITTVVVVPPSRFNQTPHCTSAKSQLITVACRLGMLCTLCVQQALSSCPLQGHCLNKHSMPCKAARKTTINQSKEEETEPVDEEDKMMKIGSSRLGWMVCMHECHLDLCFFDVCEWWMVECVCVLIAVENSKDCIAMQSLKSELGCVCIECCVDLCCSRDEVWTEIASNQVNSLITLWNHHWWRQQLDFAPLRLLKSQVSTSTDSETRWEKPQSINQPNRQWNAVGTTTINQTKEETEPVDAEDETWWGKQQSTKPRNMESVGWMVCMKWVAELNVCGEVFFVLREGGRVCTLWWLCRGGGLDWIVLDCQVRLGWVDFWRTRPSDHSLSCHQCGMCGWVNQFSLFLGL